MYRSHTGVYGPNKPSSVLSADVYLSPLLYWLAQERNWVRTRGLVNRHAVNRVGSLLSGTVTLSNAVVDSRRVAICGPCEIRMILDHTWTERAKRVTC
jgi:hypothetical protein